MIAAVQGFAGEPAGDAATIVAAHAVCHGHQACCPARIECIGRQPECILIGLTAKSDMGIAADLKYHAVPGRLEAVPFAISRNKHA